MMANLDDKILGEKLHYYCSSSDDEGENEESDQGPREEAKSRGASFIPEEELQRTGPGVSNTGPKGVIEDWRRFKQLERENRAGQEQERAQLARKLAMTCRTEGDDEAAKKKEERKEEDLDALLDVDEAFLAAYMRRRMREMVEQRGGSEKKFGRLLELSDDEQFLSSVDSEPEGATVVVLIHEEGASGCSALRDCLREVAREYPDTKFCRIAASTAGLSRRFEVGGVPAILVYRKGELISSFVRVTDTLGEDFYPSDVESFLVEHGVIQDKELVPQIIRGPVEKEDSDSD